MLGLFGSDMVCRTDWDGVYGGSRGISTFDDRQVRKCEKEVMEAIATSLAEPSHRSTILSIDNDVCPQTSDERCNAGASPFEETALRYLFTWYERAFIIMERPLVDLRKYSLKQRLVKQIG